MAALSLALAAKAEPPMRIDDRLRRARNEYAYGNYEHAAAELRALLYPMQLVTDAQVIEARTYLALSCYLLGDKAAVEEEFIKLLYLDPDYQLDPFSVAPPVIELFEAVRRKLKPQLDNIRQRQSDDEGKPRPGMLRVIETHAVERSSLAVYMPFGVGQFQNGDVRLGLIFCVSEVALLAINVGSYLWALTLQNYPPSQRGLVTALTVSQYASLVLFGTTWSIGALQAKLNFVPMISDPPVVHDEPLAGSRPLGLLLQMQL